MQKYPPNLTVGRWITIQSAELGMVSSKNIPKDTPVRGAALHALYR